MSGEQRSSRSPPMEQEPTENPQLIKIYADSQNRRHVLVMWGLFIFIVVVIYFCTLTVPDAENYMQAKPEGCIPDYQEQNPEDCDEMANSETKQYFTTVIQDLTPLNQILILEATFFKSNSGPLNRTSEYELYLNYTFSLFAVERSGKDWKITDTIANKSLDVIKINCYSYDIENDPNSQRCDSRSFLAYIPQIKHQNYYMVLRYEDPDMMSYVNQDYYLIFTINKEFTNFLLALRYTCLILSIIGFIFYNSRVKKIAKTDMVIEQKYVHRLGLALIFFNDPIYASTVLVPNGISAFLSSIFVVTFICLLLYVWLVLFERIQKENSEKACKTNTHFKFGLILAVWIFTLLAYTLMNFLHLRDPGFSFEDNYTRTYSVLKYLALAFLVGYVGWLLHSFILICRSYSSRIWRHKLFFLFSTYFIFACMLFMFSGNLSTYSYNGNRILLTISIMNIYIFFLQYMYSPSEEGIKESIEYIKHERKDENKYYNYLEETHNEILNFDDDEGDDKIKQSSTPQENNPNADKYILPRELRDVELSDMKIKD